MIFGKRRPSAASGANVPLSATLSLLALPVIPELKITDMGLVDVERFGIVPVEA